MRCAKQEKNNVVRPKLRLVKKIGHQKIMLLLLKRSQQEGLV